MNTNTQSQKPDTNPANRDPITGTPGAHPVSTGAGAVAGGAAGAVIGAVAGPIGAGVGAAVGAIAGGLAGKAAGESLDPTENDTYWRANYPSCKYAKDFRSYDDAAPAYRYGWESASKPDNKGRSFEESETGLRNDWDRAKGASSAGWDKARTAVRDAWNRVTPGSNG
ncbi:MAG TPA: glycine zipper domain-containing protein [Phycisphaerales bacterium]|nr:glycine zipper domain-containing protein [Phycisphaerales bacterium]